MSNYSLGYRGRALPFNHRHAGLISTLWGNTGLRSWSFTAVYSKKSVV